jgi:hypothetical protein
MQLGTILDSGSRLRGRTRSLLPPMNRLSWDSKLSFLTVRLSWVGRIGPAPTEEQHPGEAGGSVTGGGESDGARRIQADGCRTAEGDR